MKESIKKSLLYEKKLMEERGEWAKKTMRFIEPVIDAARKAYSLYINSLQMVIDEQKLVEEQWINKGYAYSSTFHIVSFLTQELKENEFIDELFEYGFFEHVLESYEKEVEKSEYIRQVFETIKREELKHHIPFFTLLVERLMRILTENMDTKLKPWQIRKIINNSLLEYDKNKLEELTDDEKNEVSKLNLLMQQNTKTLLYKSYTQIIEEDLFANEKSVRGRILNRHKILHGKQNFDEMKDEDLVKLGYAILLFIDLIKLKRTGKLVINKNTK